MKIDLGIWNNIFSVPTCVVDNHIIKSGSAQLKVLLYLLRYPGRDVPVEEIAQKLSLSCADVSDSLNYWICEGVILNNNINNNIAIPTFKTIELDSQDNSLNNNNLKPDSQDNSLNNNNIKLDSQDKLNPSPALDKLKIINESSHQSSSLKTSKNFFNSPGTAPRLTIKESLERIENNKNLKFLMNEVPKILKRSLTTTDIIIIISFLDWTGIDVDLALMLINYCASTDRTSAKAIEQEAYLWVNQGITTHEKAENFIRENLNLIKVQQEVIYALHKSYLTVREKAFVKKWVLDFKYNIDMIKLAYETGVTRKGEKDFSYVNGILLSWYKKGITKPEDISDENKIDFIKEKSTKLNNKKNNNQVSKIGALTSFSLDDLKAKVKN